MRFYPVVTLTSQLESTREDHQLHRNLARFARWDLVIPDEAGCLPPGKSGGDLLLQSISERRENGSLVVPTNLPFEQWTKLFHRERLPVSLLARIVDRATILAMNGPSFRLRRTLVAGGHVPAEVET